MVRISRRRILDYFRQSDDGRTTTRKGRALEDLICYLFAMVPGVSVTTRNSLNTFETEEIDVAFWNEHYRKGFWFLPNIILVEAKNWSQRVSSEEVAWFDTKLRNRGLTFGVVVAMNGITGNALDITGAHSTVAAALREQRQIIVISREEIQSITDSSMIVKLFKEKLCELAVTGTIMP